VGDLDENKRGFYVDSSSGNGSIGILAANFDLDQCLEENLLEPDDSGMSDMTVALTVMPEEPINDPNGFGDQVEITASSQNTVDLSKIYYTWKIEKSNSGENIPNDDTIWTDITTDMIEKYGSLASANQQGIGQNKLTLVLNLPENLVVSNGESIFYLRAKVVSQEQIGNTSKKASGATIIKVREQQNKINTYSVAVSEGLDLSFMGGDTEPICNDFAGRNRCYVTKNQLIGLKIPNIGNDLSGFSWKINNVPTACNNNISSLCNNPNSGILFFPILGNVGESVNLIATASSKKTGGVVEISRHFVIVEPQLQIISLDINSVWPKLIGFYKDLAGGKYPDYSTKVFETNPGKTINLKASAYSPWNAGQDYAWAIDGEIQNSNQNSLTFTVNKNAGDSYNIGLVSSIAHTEEQNRQVNNLRKALLKNWGILPEDAMEESTATNIQINVEESASFQTATNYEKKHILASLVTNLPENFMFLIKTILTAFMLIFSTGLLFAFIPENVFEKRKDNFG
jgi:hypothetical protein